MSGIFGGKANSAQQEVYSGIQVSTSLYGGCIPYVAGRQRIPFNLCWYGNFQVSTSNSGGGKGGGGSGTKTYSYSAAYIAGLCVGPIQGVHQVWHDKALVTLTYENLALALGSSGQAIWSGYPSGTPSGQKIPYDHLSYVASSAYNLGNSASMPNLTFEVEGVVPGYSDANSIYDADPSAVIPDYLLDSVHGALAGYPGTPLTIGSSVVPLTGATNSYQAYCMAMGLLTSPYEDTQRQATEFISELLQCTNSQCRLSAGNLEIIPYCDSAVSATVAGTLFSYTPNLTPVYIFTDDDYCAAKDEPPISLKQTPQSDTYNTVNIEYLNRSNYYNTDSVNCSDLNDIALNGPRLASSITWHQVTQASVAKTAGVLWLSRQLYEINTYTFKVRSDYALLEPLDYIGLNDANLGLVNQICQITEVEDDGNNVLTITALELPGVTRSTAQYDWQAAEGYFANYATDPGPVQTPAIFVMPPIPASLSEGITVGVAVAGSSSNAAWLGCDVYCSVDGGTTYQFVGVIPEACRYGTLTANIGAVADPDTTSTLAVALADTQLQLSTAVNHADADAMQTLLLVGTGPTAEVMSYGAASLISAGNYDLSYLRRDLYGSANQAHSSGDPFVRLDGAIFQIAFDPGMAGQTVDFKFVSFNTWRNYGNQTLSSATAYSYTLPVAISNSAAITLTARGNCVLSGSNAYKATTATNAWDSDVVSTSAYPGLILSATYGSLGTGNPASQGVSVLLTTSTATVGEHASQSGTYGFIVTGSSGGQLFAQGNLVGSFTPVIGDTYQMVYDGFTIDYLRNGVSLYTMQLGSQQFYASFSFQTCGATLSGVSADTVPLSTPTQWKTMGVASVNNSTLTGGNNSWTNAAYTIQGYATCHIVGKPSVSTNEMLGFSTDPTASPNYTNGNYLWYNASGTWNIYESGADIGNYGAASATDVASITYDGSTVTYYLNGVAKRTVSVAGLTLYGFATFYSPGASWNSVEFGPTTSLAVVDTSQIGNNAATAVYTATAAGPSNVYTSGAVSATLLASVAVPAIPYAAEVVVTVTGNVDHYAPSAQFSGYAVISTSATPPGSFFASEQISRNGSTSSPSTGGAWAIENTFSLPANTSQTYYLYAWGGGVASSGAYVNIYSVNLKAEVIKK